MAACPHCGAEVDQQARFCAACGAALPTGDADATLLGEPPPSSAASSTPRSPPSSAAGLTSQVHSDALFSPGALFARRYRIVGMLGKGGMGEVYRADDIKLGQPVALKFLPRQLAADPRRLARFHDEVRLARQVTHPNVCRVHDIGDWEGLHYLSMEYIDGEDLSSLLRRIGRLPSDKAVQLARQLCAGLEAAHEQGVLHRDLKPANIMIDGRGRARITDFGLAAVADALSPGDVAGTPAYMAPEQLQGGEVSVRSDIYALGLTLYEIFTGRQTHSAKTLDELKRLRSRDSQVSITRYARDADPAVESVILRCLSADPSQRPASALEVAAALPGGDPLQAALAAGETPSPEMLVASRGSQALTPQKAWAAVAGIALLLVLVAVISQQVRLTEKVGLPRPPEALADRAQELAAELGYEQDGADRIWGFGVDRRPLRWRAANMRAQERWRDLQGDPSLIFWYRSSESPMRPQRSNLRPTYGDPPLSASGSLRLLTNTAGRLLQLEAVGGQAALSPAEAETSSPDTDYPPQWRLLFERAGLDPEQWRPAPVDFTPPSFADQRLAWRPLAANQQDAASDEAAGKPLQVQMAALGGKVTYFRVMQPWTPGPQGWSPPPSFVDRLVSIVGLVLTPLILGLGLWMARRQLRQGKGDRRSAFRLAAVFLLVEIARWFITTHYLGTLSLQWGLLLDWLASRLFNAATLWLVYIALEPFARRYWSQGLISWTKMLSRGFSDRLVARDLLLGILMGAVVTVSNASQPLLAQVLGTTPPPPLAYGIPSLAGIRETMGVWLAAFPDGVLSAITGTFVFLLLRYFLKKQWLAALATVALYTLAGPGLAGGDVTLDLFFNVIEVSIVLFTLLRFGLLATVAAFVAMDWLSGAPMTLEFSAWYGGLALTTLLLTLGISTYCAYASQLPRSKRQLTIAERGL
ncbi:MAG TPA: serine/threonine-protein kinase [Acidobacteriota bacterium]|nr:serine/threonine-protein kinase [Acidobacteriota bacterium]